MSNLYQVLNRTGERTSAAPTLLPVGASPGHIAQDSQSLSLINVVNDFQWTTTKLTGRQGVPCIYLREKRLKTNALVSQSIYYSLAMSGTAGGALGGFQNLPRLAQTVIGGAAGFAAGSAIVNNSLFQNLQQLLIRGGSTALSISGVVRAFGAPGQIAGSILQAVGLGALGIGSLSNFTVPIFGTIVGATAPEYVASAGANLFSNLLGSIENAATGSNLPGEPSRTSIPSLGSNYLTPYEGLYLTADTGFFYKFPYFTDTQNKVTNAFDDKAGAFAGEGIRPAGYVGSAAEIVEEGRRLATGAAAILNLTEPGIYIERPKFYNFNNSGEAITFSFPLINTGWSDYTDVVKNWQLLYLLIYQNRPNRRTRDLINPPVIYEVSIPGVKYHPFAYISTLAVDFKGARRKMNIVVPVVGGTTVLNTIIPDAYQVTITLQTLCNESQNFLYAMLTDKQNIITVSPGTLEPSDLIPGLIDATFNEVVRQPVVRLPVGGSPTTPLPPGRLTPVIQP